jgi:AraC-like DNA-binding protein
VAFEEIRGVKSPVDSRISWVIAEMQRDVGAPLAAATLAARVALTPERFRRLFAAQTGLAPAVYLQLLRLRRARVLIERTFLPVEQVAALVGYRDARRFRRDFRRLHGVAPKALRTSCAATPLPSTAATPLAHDGRDGRARAKAAARRQRHTRARCRVWTNVLLERRTIVEDWTSLEMVDFLR